MLSATSIDQDFLTASDEEIDYRTYLVQDMINTLKAEGFKNTPAMDRYRRWLNRIDLGFEPIMLDGVVSFSVDPERIDGGQPSFIAALAARLLDVQQGQQELPIIVRVPNRPYKDVVLDYEGYYTKTTLRFSTQFAEMTSSNGSSISTDIATALSIVKLLMK